MHQAPTAEYLKRLRGCWTDAKLEQAIADASMPDPPTWAWFLGTRLAAMNHEGVIERYSAALRHMQLQKIDAPDARPLAEHWREVRAGDVDLPTLLAECAVLGPYLDSI
jgi:hypothetical protein